MPPRGSLGLSERVYKKRGNGNQQLLKLRPTNLYITLSYVLVKAGTELPQVKEGLALQNGQSEGEIKLLGPLYSFYPL